MQILILNHNIRGEATWHRAWNIALQLRKKGHDVTIFTVSPRRRHRSSFHIENDVAIYETPYLFSRRLAASGLDLFDIIWRLFAVAKIKWDVFYAFSSLPNVSLPFLFARRVFPSRKYISDWDDLFCDGGIYEYLNQGLTRPLYLAERFFERRTRRLADEVTVTSQHLLKLAEELRPERPAIYLPGGANPAAIPMLETSAARAELNLPKDAILLAYLGGGFNEDAIVMLDALKLARESLPSVCLLQIGERDVRYLERIADNGLNDAVIMTGRIPFSRVPLHLAAADILLMPLCDSLNSRARGPIKLRDYLCAGRPIIGTALGEVEYWLSRHEVGRLASMGAEAFACEIVNLARDPDAMLRLGRNARRLAEEELSWDAVAGRLQELLARMIANPEESDASAL